MTTFIVQPRGIGRLDYSKAVERSTQPFVTPTLRQSRFVGHGGPWILTPLPWPFGAWIVAWGMPQEDGTYAWTASSIVRNFFEVNVSVKSNHLVMTRLERFASYYDYLIYNVAQVFPQVFGYGKAKLDFLAGLPTQEGSLYAQVFACWTDTPTYEITIEIYGLNTELTLPWME